ncbi:MAG: YceI family protein [Reichenbachiella sp.]
MKHTIPFLIGIVFTFNSNAQRFSIENCSVKFFSNAPVEDIEAYTTDCNSIIDVSNGDMVFSIPIKGFQFEKSLMQEHFNENYLESHKYPTATFVATGVDWEEFEGTKEVLTEGTLSIHGVKKKAEMKGSMLIEKKQVIIDAKFQIELVNYKIKIPKALFYNIAETIDVTVHFEYKPYKK